VVVTGPYRVGDPGPEGTVGGVAGHA
jgi:hypothetical protein